MELAAGVHGTEGAYMMACETRKTCLCATKMLLTIMLLFLFGDGEIADGRFLGETTPSPRNANGIHKTR